MTIIYQISKEKPAGTSKKSILVNVRNDTPTVVWREFEAKGVPMDAIAADYIAATYTVQQLWDGSHPLAQPKQDAIEAAYNAASAVIDMTPPANTPEIIEDVQVLKTIVQMLLTERNAKNGI